MTVLLNPSQPVLAAAANHHDDLRSELGRLSDAMIDAIEDHAAFADARDRLVGFLRNELLPHVDGEVDLLYSEIHNPAMILLIRAMESEHRMIGALVDEIEHARVPMDAVIAAGALVVLCEVRIQQETEQLLPSLCQVGVDLTGMLADHPEITGTTSASPERYDGPAATVDLRGLDFYNRRHRLRTALANLHPGQAVQLICDGAADLTRLKYEMEDRIAQRFSWIASSEDGNIRRITIRRPGGLH